MPVEHRFTLPIRTEATLKAFVYYAWGVRIPDVKVCLNHTTPWRAFADSYFANYPTTVWMASRGLGGKTYLMSC